MPLSEYEQRVLDEMEQSLSSDDPRLATHLTSSPRRSTLRYVVAILGTLVGIGLLVVGVGSSIAVIGVIGFLVMFGSVALALAWPHRSEGVKQTSNRSGHTASSGGSGAAGRRSLIQRCEDRWDRRRSGQ